MADQELPPIPNPATLTDPVERRLAEEAVSWEQKRLGAEVQIAKLREQRGVKPVAAATGGKQPAPAAAAAKGGSE